MKLIEDSPTRRVFEERGYEARDCVKPGQQQDAPLIIIMLIVISLFSLAFVEPGIQHILINDITSREAIATFISLFVFLGCVIVMVMYLWGLYKDAKNRHVVYVFDLVEKTLSIEYITAEHKRFQMSVSPDKFQSFVVEFNPPTYAPPCHTVSLSDSYPYTIYERARPPHPEFILALKAIGLRKVDKIEKSSVSVKA